MSDVTRILNAIEGGDAKATDELLPLIYEDLPVLAECAVSHGMGKHRLVPNRQRGLMGMASELR